MLTFVYFNLDETDFVLLRVMNNLYYLHYILSINNKKILNRIKLCFIFITVLS